MGGGGGAEEEVHVYIMIKMMQLKRDQDVHSMHMLACL